MKIHKLKTWSSYYKEVAANTKKFELRNNDRDFKVGDFLLLQEYDEVSNKFTGKEVKRKITYVLKGRPMIGLWDSHAILSLDQLRTEDEVDYSLSDHVKDLSTNEFDKEQLH